MGLTKQDIMVLVKELAQEHSPDASASRAESIVDQVFARLKTIRKRKGSAESNTTQKLWEKVDALLQEIEQSSS